MKIDISTTTVVALFYAIMFGGMLNRLSDWTRLPGKMRKVGCSLETPRRSIA